MTHGKVLGHEDEKNFDLSRTSSHESFDLLGASEVNQKP